MVKTILKETIIILLLCIAILLILSILFYDYSPINKVVPNKIAYTTPDDIKEDLKEDSVQNALGVQNRVYKIKGSDLNIYKKSNAYDPSKENPFVSTSGDSNTATDTENNSQNTNSTSNGQTGLK